MTSVKPLLIGIGNISRQDDSIGIQMAATLKSSLPNWDVVPHWGEPTTLMTLWENRDHVILIDAVHSGAVPGTLYQLDLNQAKLPVTVNTGSSHGLGINEAVELSRVLQCLPKHLLFVGIEGEHYTLGEQVSPKVENALITLQKTILSLTKKLAN